MTKGLSERLRRAATHQKWCKTSQIGKRDHITCLVNQADLIEAADEIDRLKGFIPGSTSTAASSSAKASDSGQVKS